MKIRAQCKCGSILMRSQQKKLKNESVTCDKCDVTIATDDVIFSCPTPSTHKQYTICKQCAISLLVKQFKKQKLFHDDYKEELLHDGGQCLCTIL
eukprot:UN10457